MERVKTRDIDSGCTTPYDDRDASKQTGQHAWKAFFPFIAFWQRQRKSPESPFYRRFAENSFANLAFTHQDVASNSPKPPARQTSFGRWLGIAHVEHQTSLAAAASFFSFSSISGFVH